MLHNESENNYLYSISFSLLNIKVRKSYYYEGCLNEGDAKRLEHYLKTSQGRRLIRRRLKEYFYERKRKI